MSTTDSLGRTSSGSGTDFRFGILTRGFSLAELLEELSEELLDELSEELPELLEEEEDILRGVADLSRLSCCTGGT